MKSKEIRNPQSAIRNPLGWKQVKRVLVVRLRSIGDTVLSTPSLIALRRFLPDAQIDILLEDWVAPVLDGFDAVDNVIAIEGKNLTSRLNTIRELRRNRYDIAFNLHGGTTATFFTFASGARHRIGFRDYQYNFLHNHLLSSSSDFWRRDFTHSAEQQLALLGFAGVPVSDKPKSRLIVAKAALDSIEKKLSKFNLQFSSFALIHPAAAFDSKQWSTENFARVADFLLEKGLNTIAVATPNEREVLENLKRFSNAPILTFEDLTLPEITALASRAKIFVGNDSGIAHIAAAVNTSSVVVFGASNVNHWRPWTDAPNRIVYSEKTCQHQSIEIRKGSENPKCILCVQVKDVWEAIEEVI